MRSVTGLPEYPTDPEEPSDVRVHPEGRELSAEETSAALSRLWADIQKRREEPGPVRRCGHGVNLNRAGCWPCLSAAPDKDDEPEDDAPAEDNTHDWDEHVAAIRGRGRPTLTQAEFEEGLADRGIDTLDD